MHMDIVSLVVTCSQHRPYGTSSNLTFYHHFIIYYPSIKGNPNNHPTLASMAETYKQHKSRAEPEADSSITPTGSTECVYEKDGSGYGGSDKRPCLERARYLRNIVRGRNSSVIPKYQSGQVVLTRLKLSR
ncbi:hypothetical protein P167DRAFT_548864 [Morchella conica CCBAS932]|uniref:Uncharacterized protein n=1 Tax=Morchella conica CCBAS932 TaxID=1392247 RepID=A0A3N4KDA4_9PEZI|nr:hypothetical protein P167DRAFT_548864 [Morchella conica CCBAS932]